MLWLKHMSGKNPLHTLHRVTVTLFRVYKGFQRDEDGDGERERKRGRMREREREQEREGLYVCVCVCATTGVSGDEGYTV